MILVLREPDKISRQPRRSAWLCRRRYSPAPMRWSN